MTTVLATAVLSGLAAFTIWHALARVQPPGIRQAYAVLPGPVREFIGCGWCGGWWLSAAVVLVVTWGDLDPVLTPVTVFAAGGIPGVIDTLTPDDGTIQI